jgi:hypothetical protein
MIMGYQWGLLKYYNIKFLPKTVCFNKQHNSWLDEECSELLDRRKLVKLQRLQYPSQMNEIIWTM